MDLLVGITFLIARYLHIVSATLIVGGTLFYEMVFPVAIADLKDEQQLAIFARARWVFRQIVWGSAIVLVLSGAVTTAQQWPMYANVDEHPTGISAEGIPQQPQSPPSVLNRPDWWWVAHVSTGLMALVVSVALTIGSSPPTHPIRWMRLNLIILLVVIFLGSTTRHMRADMLERRLQTYERTVMAVPVVSMSDMPAPSTQPATSTSQP